MGEVVPARTSPTLHPPSPSHYVSIVVTSTLRVKSLASSDKEAQFIIPKVPVN